MDHLYSLDRTHRIKEISKEMIAEGDENEIPNPRYKLSDMFKIIWVTLWGMILLIEFGWLGFQLHEISKMYSAGELLSYRDGFDLLRRIDAGIWGPIALLLLIDLFRTTDRYFYSAVGVFSVWQFIKLLVFYFTPYPVQAYTDTLVLVLLLLGGSLLLRAAWNRPPPETLEEV